MKAKQLHSVIPKPIKRGAKWVQGQLNKNRPIAASLFMTERCNLKCKGCRRSVIGVLKSGEMTLDVVKRLLDIYPNIKSFCIAGLGEPTLNRDFTEIVDYLIEQNKDVDIITNGTNAGPILAIKLSKVSVSISLNGHDEKSYEYYTGTNQFIQVIENFQKIRTRFSNIGFSYILSKANATDLPKVLELCDNLKPTFLHLQNYLAYDIMNANETAKIITVNDIEIVHMIERDIKNRKYFISKPTFINLDKQINRCISYSRVINVDGAGNIGGCQRQIPPNERYGNIFEDDNPFNSKEMERLRQLKQKTGRYHDECRYCFGNWKG